MRSPLPRWFSALLVIVLLAAAVTVVTQLLRQAELTAAIDDTAYDLTVLQRRLEKQQLEYDQLLAELPMVQAEAGALAPDAQAAYEQEQLLRQQRKDLRAENAVLAQEIADLEALIASAEDTAKVADIDLTDKEFWRSALQTIADKIDLFCQLAEK